MKSVTTLIDRVFIYNLYVARDKCTLYLAFDVNLKTVKVCSSGFILPKKYLDQHVCIFTNWE